MNSAAIGAWKCSLRPSPPEERTKPIECLLLAEGIKLVIVIIRERIIVRRTSKRIFGYSAAASSSRLKIMRYKLGNFPTNLLVRLMVSRFYSLIKI